MIKKKDEKSQKSLQEREMARLCDTGFKFTITRKTRKSSVRLLRMLNINIFSKPREETLDFEVHQPTLAVLDRMSQYMMYIGAHLGDFETAKDDEIIQLAKNNVIEARNMAKILAIMVLGEDYYINTGDDRYLHNDKELHRLERIFFNHITPKKLYEICNACLIVCNLADFTNSTRLMAAENPSQPMEGRVE